MSRRILLLPLLLLAACDVFRPLKKVDGVTELPVVEAPARRDARVSPGPAAEDRVATPAVSAGSGPEARAGASREAAADVFAIFLTGDGGWAELDREVTEGLNAAGIPVVGLVTPRFFHEPQTPESTAAAVMRLARVYGARWDRDRILLIGFSRGADVLPFVARRLPPDLAANVAMVAMLGPGRRTRFRFRLHDLLWTSVPDTAPDVRAEIEAMHTDAPVLCIYGEHDEEALCSELGAFAPSSGTGAGAGSGEIGNGRGHVHEFGHVHVHGTGNGGGLIVVRTGGGHHLDGAYRELGREIARRIGEPRARDVGREERR